jgi:hypothetical protein
MLIIAFAAGAPVKAAETATNAVAALNRSFRETLENQADPRDNCLVIAERSWIDGR